MSWEKFQLEGFELTEKDTVALTKDTINQYKKAIADINESIKTQYAKYLASVDKDNFYNEMLKFNRLEKLQAEVIKEYTEYSLKAGVNIGNIGRISMSNMYYRTQYQFEWLEPVLKMPVLPKDLINISVFGSDKAYRSYTASMKPTIFGVGTEYMPKAGTLSSLLKKNRTVELKQIIDTITNGLVQGTSYTDMAKSIKQVIGTTLIQDGKLHASGSIADALRIVRTESTRILNDASYAASKNAQSQGLDVKKIWISTLDNRTRPLHGQLDGQIREIDKPFEAGGYEVQRPGQFPNVGNNINCRCAVTDVLNDQSPKIRRGRDPVTGKNEVFTYRTYDQWTKEKGLTNNIHGQIIPK